MFCLYEESVGQKGTYKTLALCQMNGTKTAHCVFSYKIDILMNLFFLIAATKVIIYKWTKELNVIKIITKCKKNDKHFSQDYF